MLSAAAELEKTKISCDSNRYRLKFYEFHRLSFLNNQSSPIINQILQPQFKEW